MVPDVNSSAADVRSTVLVNSLEFNKDPYSPQRVAERLAEVKARETAKSREEQIRINEIVAAKQVAHKIKRKAQMEVASRQEEQARREELLMINEKIRQSPWQSPATQRDPPSREI